VKFPHHLSSGIRLPSSDNISQFHLLRNQCAKWTKLICDTPCMVLFLIKSGDNFVHPRWFPWLLIGWNLEIFLILLSFHSYALTKPDCCDQIRFFTIYHVDSPCVIHTLIMYLSASLVSPEHFYCLLSVKLKPSFH
jgi:hypothetical protein